MHVINRQAIVVVPQQPVLDWMNALTPEALMTLEELQEEPNVYLVEDAESGDSLRRHFARIFEEELAGWWTREEEWPANRDFALFQRWFACTTHSMVMDLLARPIRRESL